MPIPPDNRARGDTGHIGDHNNIADELTAITSAVSAETSRAETAEAGLLIMAGTFTQPFTSTATVTVTHNLGRYPAVTVVDTAGDEVDGDVQYLTNNSLTVTFSAPSSGDIYLN